MKKLFQSVLGKNLVFSIMTVIAVGLATGILSYIVQKNITEQLLWDRAKSIAVLWNSTLDLELIEKAKNDTDLESSTQKEMIEDLNRLSELEPNIAQAYIYDAKYANEEKEMKMVAVPQNIIDAGLKPGDLYANSKSSNIAFEKVLTTKKLTFLDIYKDKFGTWLTVLVPIQNESGEIIGVFGADLDATIMDDVRNDFIITVSVGIVIMLILISIIQFFGIRRMLAPVKVIMQGIEEVSNGNLTAEIKVKSKDEFGQLGQNFNKMNERLNSLIRDASHVAEQVNTTTKEFIYISQQTVEAASQLGVSLDEVSESMAEQSNTTEESARSMEEMAQGIQRAAESTAVVSEKSTDTLSETKNGKEFIESAINQISSIKKAVEESSGIIQVLGSRSKEIGDIVSVISSIADQTNLLALNAAIEAARAGEAGKGFAVVADEVRKLAEQSQGSATQIISLISSTQEDTNKAVEAMRKGTSEVETGVELINQIGVIINKIVSSTQQVTEEIQEISAVFEELSASTEEVNSSVDEISQVAKETLASFTGFRQNSKSQIESMKSLKETSQSLATMAEDLGIKLKSFTV